MTDLTDWFAKVNAKALDRHNEERTKGLHDARCEWHTDFHFCHCHRRARLARGETVAPELVYMDSECSGCGQPATHDGDGFVCYGCQVGFGNHYDEPGEWQDVYAPNDEELAAQSLAARERASAVSS